MLIESVIFLFIIQIAYSYKTNPTSWICTESANEISSSLPACLPGYTIDIEDVVYESTTDDSCRGTTLCHIENKNTLLFACNRKRTCNIDTNNLHFHINSTCGSTKRFFVTYRCLPVIQEQKDYLCDASTQRRARLGDINLSCEKKYRLYIKMASIGISIKQQDELNKNRFKCNKDTPTICNSNVPSAYRDVCDSQIRDENDDQCKIRFNERPMLKDCQHGTTSNFSMVEYLCIPGGGITDDLPRIDICSTDIPERISVDRGLLHSPNYPQALGQYLTCKKQLVVPRESRFRLFMLEKSIEYSHEFNIRSSNNVQTLARNELIDINVTNQNNDKIVQFELKTNHVGGGNILLYFQIDSRISEYAPFILEPEKDINGYDRRGKTPLTRDWGILIGCIIGLLLVLLVIATIFIIFRISKRHRDRSLRYLKSDDDHRQRLSLSTTSPDDHHHHHHHQKHLHIEQPYLSSSPPAMLPPSSTNGHNRPNSASSTTSSIIMHQINDGLSDRESLIKPIDQAQSRSHAINSDIDNFYEEIKEQQQQTALALGKNDTKGDIGNPYLEAKSFETNQIVFQGIKPVPPIRDHHESQQQYQSPSNTDASTVAIEPKKRSTKTPPKIPQPAMDIKSSEPSTSTSDLNENNN